MDILYLLIPLSAVLVLFIVAVFGWAVHKGQFEDLEREADRILTDDAPVLDADQAGDQGPAEESRRRSSASS
ncbi:MAG: cbb3-type cytochrome oxidase assembly protein CcoS [Burkholderiales bacterium]|nr:cbb3-type cytochrome oxidase assembly protein CcoS [Burkholderiales bacterium]